jgi:prepilin-type N-terminal cleavage/methylation domain-containing protein
MKTILTKGFTLIELLVVIAIIGILTSIITANFATTREKARDAKRISDIAQIQLLLEQIFDRCNKYPPNLNISSIANICGNYTWSYFASAIPTDNGTPYTYLINPSSNPTNYVLKAGLEVFNSGVFNDSGDIDNDENGYLISISNWYKDGQLASSADKDCNDYENSDTGQRHYYCVTPK